MGDGGTRTRSPITYHPSPVEVVDEALPQIERSDSMDCRRIWAVLGVPLALVAAGGAPAAAPPPASAPPPAAAPPASGSPAAAAPAAAPAGDAGKQTLIVAVSRDMQNLDPTTSSGDGTT